MAKTCEAIKGMGGVKKETEQRKNIKKKKQRQKQEKARGQRRK